MSTLKTELVELAKSAQDAFRNTLTVSSEIKNAVLKDMAEALLSAKTQIIKANKKW